MEKLKTYLNRIGEAEISDSTELENILAECWEEFTSEYGGMKPHKLLGRMEEVNWKSPILSFVIERHGGTVLGSTRADIQRWNLNIEQKTASVTKAGYRQIYKRDSVFDVEPIADKLAGLIINGRRDELLKWSEEGRVQILTGKIIYGPRNTAGGRRKRLNKALEERLNPKGWNRKGAWWQHK